MFPNNCKVRCKKYNGTERYFTIGKIYDVVNGAITNDRGFKYTKDHDEDDVMEWLGNWYEFELVNKSDYDIERVIFNDPATIVLWSDGTKTVVKCQPGDTYDAEKGLALCIAKKYFGNKGNFNEVFKKWIPEEIPKEEETPDFTEMWDKLDQHCADTYCRECVLKPLMKSDGGCYADVPGDILKKHYEMVFKN